MLFLSLIFLSPIFCPMAKAMTHAAMPRASILCLMRSSSAASLGARSRARRRAVRHSSRRQFAAVYHPPGHIDRFEDEPFRSELDGYKGAGLVIGGGVKRVEIGR